MSWSDKFGFYCQLKSSFNEVPGSVCYSITRENVIKTLNRKAYLSSEWILEFLLSTSHQVPNLNRVFVFPTIFRLPLSTDSGNLGKKGKSTSAEGSKDMEKKKKKEALVLF